MPPSALFRTSHIFCALIGFAWLICGSVNSQDLIDSLEQLDPDPIERPSPQSVLVPESLDQYLKDSPVATSHGTGALGNHSLADREELESLSQMARWLLLSNLPESYEDNKKWGLQKEVYDGFRFRREGLKVETYRKYKTVKHGTWSRYYLEMVEPEKNLKLELTDLRSTASNRFSIRASVQAPFHVFGRIAQWQRDIQLISLSMNADVVAAMEIQAEVEVQVNPLTIPPAIQFFPKVEQAKVRLHSMEVHRISQIHGDLAEELGKGMRGFVDDRLASYDDKLVAKLNQQLDKKKDKLKITGDQIWSRWLKQ